MVEAQKHDDLLFKARDTQYLYLLIYLNGKSHICWDPHEPTLSAKMPADFLRMSATNYIYKLYSLFIFTN